jgi:hypothetical protein
MSSQPELFEHLQELANARKPVELINTYRGIPVVQSAQIHKLDQGYVSFFVHPHQATCLALEGRTFMRLPHGGVYRARAVAVDVPHHQVVLADFEIADTSVGQRMSLRVQSPQPLDVEIITKDAAIPAKVADLSTQGMGLYALAAYTVVESHLHAGEQVAVTMTLPEGRPLYFHGKISSQTKTANISMQRIGLEIYPDEGSLQDLQEFVAERSSELLDELERVYRSMCNRTD